MNNGKTEQARLIVLGLVNFYAQTVGSSITAKDLVTKAHEFLVEQGHKTDSPIAYQALQSLVRDGILIVDEEGFILAVPETVRIRKRTRPNREGAVARADRSPSPGAERGPQTTPAPPVAIFNDGGLKRS
jgi:hypothetical protein